jgi:hypothetical protein
VWFVGTEQQDVLEVFNDRIRQVLVGDLPEQRRRSYHRRLAMAIKDIVGDAPEVLVHHFKEAGDLERAADFVTEAADRALASLAFIRAAHLYQLALDLPRTRQPDTQLLEKLGQALEGSGRSAEAARVLQRAASAASGPAALDLRRQAAELFLKSGHLEEGRSSLEAVLREAGIRSPASPRQAYLALGGLRARVELGGTRARLAGTGEADARLRLRIDACWTAANGLVLVDPVFSSFFRPAPCCWRCARETPTAWPAASAPRPCCRSCGAPAMAASRAC